MAESQSAEFPTALAATVQFRLADVDVLVRHAIELLERHGPAAKAVVLGIMKLVKLATERDLLGVFVQLQATVIDVQALIAAIRAEFPTL